MNSGFNASRRCEGKTDCTGLHAEVNIVEIITSMREDSMYLCKHLVAACTYNCGNVSIYYRNKQHIDRTCDDVSSAR